MPAPLPPPLLPPDVQLLTEIGFVAAAAGLHKQSLKVFNSLGLLRPHRAFPYIGQATTFLNEGQHDAAENALRHGRRVLDDKAAHEQGDDQDLALLNEDRALLAAFHGLALQLSHRSAEAARALSDALALQPSGAAARMASVMLGLPMPPMREAPAGLAESLVESAP